MPTRNIWHIIWTVYLDKHNKEGPTKRIFQFLHSITFTSIWLGWPVSSAVLVLLESTPLSDTLRNQMGSFQFWYRPLSTMKRRVNKCLMLSYLRELRKIKNKFLFMWKKIACSACLAYVCDLQLVKNIYLVVNDCSWETLGQLKPSPVAKENASFLQEIFQ